MRKFWDRLGSLTFVSQPFSEKENSEIKPVVDLEKEELYQVICEQDTLQEQWDNKIKRLHQEKLYIYICVCVCVWRICEKVKKPNIENGFKWYFVIIYPESSTESVFCIRFYPRSTYIFYILSNFSCLLLFHIYIYIYIYIYTHTQSDDRKVEKLIFIKYNWLCQRYIYIYIYTPVINSFFTQKLDMFLKSQSLPCF